MRRFWTALYTDSKSLASMKRFGLKLGMITVFALLQIPTAWGGFRAFVTLALSSASISLLCALVRREPLANEQFNYWDEVLIFLLLGLVAGLKLV
jgi:hypothetical protein